MPGRLVMEEQGAIGSKDLKKDRSHAQEAATNSQPPPVQAQSIAQANGSTNHLANGVLPNGVPANGLPPPTTNGASTSTSTSRAGQDDPTPLDQSWRDHSDNKSLGLLMKRLAQQCYYDLNETLTQMSEVPVEPQQQQANGVVPHTGPDTSEGSLKKKRLLMEFAGGQRDRFIKTLVLSDWCRNGEEQGRLIDVKVWQDKQRNAHEFATRAIGNTKNNMIAAKMPNPNIEGAMELLATGKASWVPDLGYITPKRLGAKQLLKTLRNMNVTLATRLSLHEDLPPHFQHVSIADGRATFAVKDEFEVDLSVADEDPATPFYFIDIRLLFKPTSDVLDDKLRSFLEGKANQELATKGLNGCYDFLHNFVLTHKINVLRSQAGELIRGKWFDCILPESRRRNFLVQYWVGMAGPKSWMEIGVSSGKQKDAYSRQAATPRISVRWFRRGVEVKEGMPEFDWQNLDLEEYLSVLIAKHTAFILNDLQNRVRVLAPARSPMVAKITKVGSVAQESVLSLNLPSLREPLQVRVEPITGQSSISPPSPATAHTERRLNSDPTIDAAKWLAFLVCGVVRERVLKEAELLGWALTPNLVRQDNLQKLFGDGIRHFSFFSPTRAWGDRWALAVSFGLGGETWWVVLLEDKLDEQSKVMGKVIASARRVSLLDATGGEVTVSQGSLMRVERLAVAQVAFSALSKQLNDLRIQHKFEKLAIPLAGGSPAAHTNSAPIAMYIRFSQLLKESQKKAWAAEMVRLTHHGVLSNTDGAGDGPGSVRHDLRLSLEPGKMKNLQKHLTHFKDQDLAMSSSGGLALRFLTPFGQAFAEQIQKRLLSIGRLDRFVAVLNTRRYKCTHVSLSRLAFTYNNAPELSARLTFSSDGDLPAKLKLEPPDSNPHQRIRVMLEQGLNSAGDKGFDALTFVLGLTLPVVQTFERLESIDPAKQILSIHPRTSTWYSINYSAPLPGCAFQLRAKTKTQGKTKLVRWYIEEERKPADSASWPEDLSKALKELWQDRGEHWEGLGKGIVADAQGVAVALEKVDEVVRRFEGSGEESSKPAEGDGQPATEPTKSQAQPSAQSTSRAQTQKPASKGTAAPGNSEHEVIMLD